MDRVRVVFIALVVSAWISPTTSHAQNAGANNRFRLAQSYEQGGDFESATRLYKELLAAEPTNSVFFDGLRRSLLQLKRYDDAIGLIHHRLGSYPNDINLLCLLGSAQYQSGKEKEASASWEQAIALEPANANIYRLVANTLLENRLLDKTAELYRRARKECHDANLFTIDLAQLLSITMDYAGATEEFLRYLQQAPMQLGFVQSRMAQFTGKEEARGAALEVVRTAQRRSDDVNLHRLLGWLLLEGKRFAEALEVYKRIDRLSNAAGVEIYSFAERAYKEGAYAVAAEAYREAISIPLALQRLPYAKFGYALCVKELSIQSDTSLNPTADGSFVPESQSRYATAIDYFRKIIAEYPHTEFAGRSFYQIGTIQFEKYFDLDGALASFQSAEKSQSPSNSILFDVAIKVAEVLTAKGDTGQASLRLRSVVAAPNATPDQQDEATYRLAELEYFGGNFNGALKNLEAISANLKANYANDALQLHSFLQENILTGEQGLKEFARADFLSKQNKFTEAVSAFQKVIEQNTQALFVDEGLMRIATLQTRSGRYADALATYQKLLAQFTESSIALDKAQFGIAQIYDYHLRDTANATAAYEKLLADYPASLLIDRARRRIRELRGDSL
jgi:tetratricopeptide (TPR) repeat protein